jgi:hypothetical protein
MGQVVSCEEKNCCEYGPRHPEAGLLNKSSCLAPTLGITRLIIVKDIILVTLLCHLSPM